MSNDNTIYSAKNAQGAPAPARGNQKTWLIIGGVGCALLLCVVLLVGGGLFLAGDRLNGLAASLGGQTPTPVPTATTPPTATLIPEPPSPTPTPPQAESNTAPTNTPTPSAPAQPLFGVITFALDATADYQAVNPGASFKEGITKVHAIFDYSGMSPDTTWERVWYLNGKELTRKSAPWNEKESGRFDYFIDAGGAPLSPGEWVLELYVQGQLAAKGSFTIEPKTVAQATATSIPAEAPIPAPTSTPKPSGGSGGGVYKLVYTKWDGGQHNMYVADTNGKEEQFILGRAAGPSWSPDGKYIFFYGEQGIDRQTVNGVEYVFDGISNGVVSMGASPLPKNVGEVRLFQGLDWKQGTARWANVAPNGQMVAFDAKPGGNDYRIYFLGTADNKQYKFEILGEQADWSPDSQKVVYRSGRDGKTGIWISNRDDSGHTNITTVGSDSFPAWSPNGKTIAFSRDEGGNVDIYTMNVDGSNVKRLTDAPGPDALPVYTPSGDIIFRSARSGSWGIWKMSGSGANQKEIIPNAGVGNDWTFSRMDVR